MHERELLAVVASALEQTLDECEVRLRGKGVVLDFVSGERWLLQPLDLSELDGDDESEDEEDDDDGPCDYG